MSANATALVQRYTQYADNFNGADLVDAMNARPEIPIAAAVGYVIFVFAGQTLMKSRGVPPLRWVTVLWNLFLAVFSICGAIVTVPYLIEKVLTKGVFYTTCEDPHNWFFHGPSGLWVGLFILSKIPEMIDTVLLVLQKKPVILLHWYHHATVMLYCWDAWTKAVAPGIWFASMNYSVHALMYTYYFMMSLSATTRKMVRPFAQMITTLQIVQMVFGFGFSALAGYFIHFSETPCHAEAVNNAAGLAMYGSYFVLFAMLFKKLYLSGDKKKKAKADAEAKKVM